MQQHTLNNSVAGHKSANIAVGAASASATLPTNSTLVAMSTVGNCHFRTGLGAQTAVGTDPLLTAASGLIVVNIPATHDTIAVIQNAASTGTFNFYPVFED